MKMLSSPLEKTGICTGLITALALIIYFLIIKQFGLSQVLGLRFINFFILCVGVVYSIKVFTKEIADDDRYLKGMGMGLYTSAVTVVIFAFFMSFYLAYFDTALMAYIKSTVSFGEFINGMAIFLIIFLEGMASGLIITFCAMQYYKAPRMRSGSK